MKWVTTKKTCPECKTALTAKEVFKNYQIEKMITIANFKREDLGPEEAVKET